MPSQSSFPLEKLRAKRNSIESLPLNLCRAGVACVLAFTMGCQSDVVVVGSVCASAAATVLNPGEVKADVVDLEMDFSAIAESSSALTGAEQRSSTSVSNSGSSCNCCCQLLLLLDLLLLAMAGSVQRQLLRFLSVHRMEDVLWLSLVTQL